MNKTAINNLENAISLYETQIENADQLGHLSKEDMLRYALEGEKISTSRAHIDNIAPSLLGGLILVRDIESLDVINIPISDFYFAVVNSDILIKTDHARKILPKEIKLSLAVKQWGHLGSLIYGFTSKNNNLINRSMKDFIIEPIRSRFITGFDSIKTYSVKNGALACNISGSGPSIFALCPSSAIAGDIIYFAEKYYNSISLSCNTYLSKVNHVGPVVI